MWTKCSGRQLSVVGACLFTLLVTQARGNELSGTRESSLPIPEVYFGQTAPGETPVLFAPAILASISPWVEATELSPDGTMFFVGVGDASYSSARLLYSKLENGAWTPFVAPPFVSSFEFSHEPVFSAGGDSVTFTGRGGTEANDFWVVRYNAGTWGTPVSLPSPINSSAKEWRGSWMADGTFYFGSTRAIPNNNQIFKAYKDAGQNIVVEKLGAPINNSSYEGDPCIAPDGHFLVFYSGRNGASTDLFVSFKNSGGGWDKPINLGASFNSGFDEYGAHLSHNGKYLFFTRHTSSGNQIYWVATSAIEKLAPPTATVLQMVGHTLTDSIGNHDGRAQAGETVLLSSTIRNAGLDATNITGSLATTDPFITITRETTSYPGLVWKAQGTAITPFALTIDPACPDPHTAILALTTNSATGGGFTDTIVIFIGTKPGYGDDMESGDGLWKHKAVTVGSAEQWHQEDSRSHSGINSWKMGGAGSTNYLDNCDAGLVSPPFLLPEKPRLSFWHQISAEFADDTTAWDGAVVSISTGVGQWAALTPIGGYSHKLSTGTTAPAGTRCYSGNSDWAKAEFDLSGYTGVHQIIFRFLSDGAITGEGWYIDDVRVTGCCEGLSGNVDCDPAGGCDISDLATLIDYMYITFTPLCCTATANIDGQAGIDISDLSALIDYMYISFTPPTACQ